jgi:hypothetical protein
MAPREHDSLHFEGIAAPPRVGGALPGTQGDGIDKAAIEVRLAPPRGLARRSGWTYLGHAAIHPSNLLLLIGVMFLSLILWSAPVLFLGLGLEAALLCAAPVAPFFRRRIDLCIDEAERAEAQKAREALIREMSEGHRQELARIEGLLDKTSANAARQGAMIPLAVTEPLGNARLLTSYIRLAIAHRACEESLAMTNRHVLEGTIRSLEAAVGTGAERTRRLVQRRLGIAYRRAECWSRTRDSLEAIGHQLATISELVLLLHQESLAPTGTAWGTVEVDRILADFEDGEGALRELLDIDVEVQHDLPLEAACSRRIGG